MTAPKQSKPKKCKYSHPYFKIFFIIIIIKSQKLYDMKLLIDVKVRDMVVEKLI